KSSSGVPSQSSSNALHTSDVVPVVSLHTRLPLAHTRVPSTHTSPSAPSQLAPTNGSSEPSADAGSQSSSAPSQPTPIVGSSLPSTDAGSQSSSKPLHTSVVVDVTSLHTTPPPLHV